MAAAWLAVCMASSSDNEKKEEKKRHDDNIDSLSVRQSRQEKEAAREKLFSLEEKTSQAM